MEAWLAWFRSRALFRTSLLVLAVACTACASRGRYTRVEDLPPAPPSSGDYRIQSGDLLEIRVYNEERLTSRPRVRSDGRIVLTLVGEVQVKGKTLSELAQEIGQRLQRYLQNPSVTVSLEERGTLAVTVVGEVAHPGVFNLPRDSGVLQAIATAGGLTEFADEDAIFVLRTRPSMRIRFTNHALTHNDVKSVSFTLMDGDVVAVE